MDSLDPLSRCTTRDQAKTSRRQPLLPRELLATREEKRVASTTLVDLEGRSRGAKRPKQRTRVPVGDLIRDLVRDQPQEIHEGVIEDHQGEIAEELGASDVEVDVQTAPTQFRRYFESAMKKLQRKQFYANLRKVRGVAHAMALREVGASVSTTTTRFGFRHSVAQPLLLTQMQYKFNGRKRVPVCTNVGSVACAEFDKSARRLATGASDGVVAVFSGCQTSRLIGLTKKRVSKGKTAGKQTPILRIKTHYGGVQCVQWSPAEPCVLACGFLNNNRILVYDIRNMNKKKPGQPKMTLHSLTGSGSQGTNVLVYDPWSGTSLSCGSSDGYAQHWDLRAGSKPVWEVDSCLNASRIISKAINSMVHPEEHILVMGGGTGLLAWDLRKLAVPLCGFDAVPSTTFSQSLKSAVVSMETLKSEPRTLCLQLGTGEIQLVDLADAKFRVRRVLKLASQEYQRTVETAPTLNNGQRRFANEVNENEEFFLQNVGTSSSMSASTAKFRARRACMKVFNMNDRDFVCTALADQRNVQIVDLWANRMYDSLEASVHQIPLAFAPKLVAVNPSNHDIFVGSGRDDKLTLIH